MSGDDDFEEPDEGSSKARFSVARGLSCHDAKRHDARNVWERYGVDDFLRPFWDHSSGGHSTADSVGG